MKKDDTIRAMIARESARLMYEEGIREYRDAKRKAAKRFGHEKALSLGSHLPSNAEIHAELQKLIDFYEEKILPERLLKLRLIALEYMEFLEAFSPYLVGSVLSGAATERSDIDLHLFADYADEVEELLNEKGIPFEREVVSIRRGGEFIDYFHIYLMEGDVVIECTVYPPEFRNCIPKSSITGKPMERANINKLRRIVADMMKPEDSSDE